MKKMTLMMLLIVSNLIYAQTVTYQGELKANSEPVNTSVDFEITYYNDSQAGPGTLLGFEFFNSVPVVDGLFTLTLGSTGTGPIPLDHIFNVNSDVWIELKINGVIQSPLQKISLVPYAIDSLSLDGLLATEYALTTDITSLQSQIDSINIGTTPWIDGFGGTQYIGDVIIGDLAASAGDTLQIVSEVDESPLRVLVGGVGTRFRVSKNGGTGVGANYSDGQIPDNGLRVSGDTAIGNASSSARLTIGAIAGQVPLRMKINGVTKFMVQPNGGTNIGGGANVAPGNGLDVEGTVFAKSDMKVYRNLAIGPNASFAGSTSLQINSESGRSPLRIKINNSTKMRIYTNGGTSLGGNTTPETNGLVVQGTVLARSHVEIGNVNISGSGAPPELAINGVNPLSVQVNGTTRLNVSDVGGVGIGGNSGFQIPQNGLYVNGDAKFNSDLIVNGKPKQDLGSHGFAKAGIKFPCGNLPLPIFNSFNNINTGSILVLPHVIPGTTLSDGLCKIQFPFNIGGLFIQVRTDASDANLDSILSSCKIKSGSSTVLECRSADWHTATNTNSIVTLLLF